MKKLLLLCCCFAILAACNDDDSIIEPSKNPVQLDKLEVGQKSYFLNYLSNCDSLNTNFHLTGDTLVLEVVEENGALKFKESFTEHSPKTINNPTSPVFYSVEAFDNFVLIPQRFESNLFFFYGNDTIHINNLNQEAMIQNECRIDFNGSTFIGNEIGLIDEFKIGDFKQKNKTVVSCVPMMWNLDAYLIYDKNALYMSHSVNQFDNSIAGWVLLE